MAQVFKFRWNTTDLVLTAAADAGLRFQSWKPKAATPGLGGDSGPVIEVIDLRVDRVSQDLMASSLIDLGIMRLYASRYIHDPTFAEPVYLHAQMENETNPRRAVVRRIDMEWRSEEMTAYGPPASNEALLRLHVEREPWWEAIGSTVVSGVLSETAAASIAWEYTAGGVPHSIAGDVPARVYELSIYSDASGAAVTRLWMGFRSANKHGTLANFANIWECEDGTNNALESGITDDGAADVNGASPGSGSGVFVELVETDLEWDAADNGGIFQEVLELKLSDISANEADNFGDYMWLLRHQLSAGSSTWEVQLRFGYSGMDDNDFMRGPIVEVSSTGWDYVKMGRMPIPLRPIQVFDAVSDSLDSTYAIQVWARRTSGASNLELDCLCPIPIDEGWCRSWGFSLPAGSGASWRVGESPSRAMFALAYVSATKITHLPKFAQWNFRFPLGDALLVLVYSGATHDLTTGVSGTGFHFERWANLRGSV